MKKLYRLLSIFLALITMIASITVQSFANDPYESDAPVATAEFHFKHPLEYVPDEYEGTMEYIPEKFDPEDNQNEDVYGPPPGNISPDD